MSVARIPSTPPLESAEAIPDPSARLEWLLREHFRLVWRALRRLGVSEGALDDASQQVFMVVAAKLQDIEPGKEKSFLIGTAIRTAANARRKEANRPDLAGDYPAEPQDLAPDAETLLERKQMRVLLDQVLGTMPFDLRTVFVLYEFENQSMAEIARLLEIPMGTVASRLRRARELFETHVARLRARYGGAS